MFRLASCVRGPSAAVRRPACRPSLECLEDRTLLATTTFVLDFTPDNRNGSFAQTFFDVRMGGGLAPRFFDFDGNGRVNAQDVSIAAGQVAGLVRNYYASFLRLNLRVDYGDVLSDTGLGTRSLNSGLRSRTAQVAVMNVGGHDRFSNAFGLSPVARDGRNIEGASDTYTRAIAENLLARNPTATPREFATRVASTVAHELGHLMGLRHATSGPRNNLMRHERMRGNDFIVNGFVNTSGGPRQNAALELANSFRGQPTSFDQVNSGARDRAANPALIWADYALSRGL